MSDDRTRPEWTPKDAGAEFASSVLPGVPGGHDGMPGQNAGTFATRPPRERPKVQDVAHYVGGILEGNRTVLAQAITLVESQNPEHNRIAQDVVRELLPSSGNSIRLGITGSPGAGKSTFIDALGTHLCDAGHRVAVLAVDPSSGVSGGSILGDKTRMERLAHLENAFIRPSPTGGNLGGVTRKSRETIVLCEAFGFDTILIETVGVGQSETTVRSMVDFFLVLILANAGDELQGIKKGIIELADALLINKADGDRKRDALLAREEYARALEYLSPATPGWKTAAYTCSALTGAGIREFWDEVERFRRETKASGQFDGRRRQQRLDWVFAMAEQTLRDSFYRNPTVSAAIPGIRDAVGAGTMTASAGAQELLRLFAENFRSEGLRP